MKKKIITLNIANDEDIKSWVFSLKKRRLEYSFFIKQFLLKYINNEETIISKVHLKNSEITRISLNITEPQLLEFLETLKNNNLKHSKVIKSIIKKNIKIIPSYQDEVLPELIDFISLEKGKPIENPKENTTKKEEPKQNKKVSSLALKYTNFR